MLLIPINQRQMHWMLAVLDLRNRHIYVVDSMQASEKRAEHYAKCLNRVVNDLYDQSTEKSTILNHTIVKHVPRQTNANDCGLALCLNMAEIAESQQPNAPFCYNFDVEESFSKLARKMVAV